LTHSPMQKRRWLELNAMLEMVMVSNCKEIVQAKVSNEGVTVPDDLHSGICWGAFLSFQDAIMYVGYEYPDGTRSPSPRPFFAICASDATTSQLIKVFVHYTEQHPERLHLDFFQIALDAGREAFQCKSAH
jgi:hypothetical protein